MLSRRLKSSFLFVNDPFAIKCCATTQTKSLLYIHCLWNRFLAKSTSLPKILSKVSFLCGGDFRSRAGQRKRSSFTNMQIWDEPLRLHTLPYNDTQGVYKLTWKLVKTAERNSNMWEWIFHQLAAKNLNVNAVQRSIARVIWYCKVKNNYGIHYLTGQNRGLSLLKIFGRSSWPATCCPLFWALYSVKLSQNFEFFYTAREASWCSSFNN